MIFVFTVICCQFFIFFSPKWLTLQGVSPSWSILWLLPWSLSKGKFFGLVAGFCLGLFLDGISTSGASHLPAMIFLGYWWGQLGSQG